MLDSNEGPGRDDDRFGYAPEVDASTTEPLSRGESLRRSPPQPEAATGPRSFNRVLELSLYGIVPVATLVTAPILAHGLGPDGRGQYGVAIAVAQFVGTLGNWGQAEIFLSRARTGTDYYRMHSRITWFGGVIASVVSLVVMMALHLPLAAAMVTAIWVPVGAQVGLWRAASIAQGELRPPAIDGASGSVLRVAALASLAALGLLSVNTSLFASQAALAVGSILTVGIATRRSGFKARKEGVAARTLVASGTGIIAFNLLHAVTLRSDIIVLQLTASPTEVGLYAAPAGLTGAALALSMAYRPRVQAALFSEAPFRGITNNCLQVFALGSVATIVMWAVAPFAVSILFGSSFDGAVPIMRILVFAIVPLLMVDLTFAALIVLGHQRDLLIVAAGGAILNLGALSILCSLWGASGAALATVISNSLAAVLGFVVLYFRHANKPPRDKLAAR